MNVWVSLISSLILVRQISTQDRQGITPFHIHASTYTQGFPQIQLFCVLNTQIHNPFSTKSSIYAQHLVHLLTLAATPDVPPCVVPGILSSTFLNTSTVCALCHALVLASSVNPSQRTSIKNKRFESTSSANLSSVPVSNRCTTGISTSETFPVVNSFFSTAVLCAAVHPARSYVALTWCSISATKVSKRMGSIAPADTRDRSAVQDLRWGFVGWWESLRAVEMRGRRHRRL